MQRRRGGRKLVFLVSNIGKSGRGSLKTSQRLKSLMQSVDEGGTGCTVKLLCVLQFVLFIRLIQGFEESTEEKEKLENDKII